MAGRLSLGGAYRNTYGIHFFGGELLGGIGVERPDLIAFGQLSAFVGTSEAGLFTSHVRLGPAVEWTFGRVHVGGGAEIGLCFIRRTTSGDLMTSFSLGLAPALGVDLSQWEGGAFYVAVLPHVDINPLTLAASLHLGVRL